MPSVRFAMAVPVLRGQVVGDLGLHGARFDEA